jgi:hypothetical protein
MRKGLLAAFTVLASCSGQVTGQASRDVGDRIGDESHDGGSDLHLANGDRHESARPDKTGDGAAPAQLCDGTSNIRLHGRYLSRNSGFVTRIFDEIGHRAFWLDGRCRFWVHELPPEHGSVVGNTWPTVRAGSLTPAEAESIHEELRVDLWRAYDGRPEPTPSSHSPVILLADGRRTVQLSVATNSPESREIQSGFLLVLRRLRNQGAEVGGRLRVAVNPFGGPALHVTTWPLAVSRHLLSKRDGAFRSELITNDEELAALRALRRDYQGGRFGWGDVPIGERSGGANPTTADHFLQIRDVLPFESEGGGVGVNAVSAGD